MKKQSDKSRKWGIVTASRLGFFKKLVSWNKKSRGNIWIKKIYRALTTKYNAWNLDAGFKKKGQKTAKDVLEL